MKNLFIISTDKPSRLHSYKGVLNLAAGEFVAPTIVKNDLINQNIYITSDEEITGFENNIWVIKGQRVFLWQNTMALVSNNKPRKIILTTDQDLIKEGVQSIDDEFLEWFVKNPSCEEVDVYIEKYVNLTSNPISIHKIIIPKQEPKQETLEEAAKRKIPELKHTINSLSDARILWIKGAKWQKERMYSEEDMRRAFEWGAAHLSFEEWLKQFKKK